MERVSRILIIDDDVALASNLKDILEDEGYTVSMVHSGKDALALCRKTPFTLTISDIKLPDVSGVDLAGRMAEIAPGMETIIITGNASIDTAVDAVSRRSIVAYKTKPLDMGDFLVLLGQVIERKQTEEALRESEKRTRLALIETRQREAEVKALLAAAQSILFHADFPSAARAIFDRCKQLLGAASGYVALLSADASTNEIVFLDVGEMPCTVNPSVPMSVRGLREQVYRLGETVCENDFSGSRWVKLLPEGHVQLRNVLLAPLKIEGKVVGLLSLGDKPGGFSQDDMRLAAAFGELAAIAFINFSTAQSLKNSESRYRSVVSNIPDTVWTGTNGQGLTFISPNIQKITGYPPDELLGAKGADALSQIIQKDDLVKVKGAVDALFKDGAPFDMEHRVLNREGKCLWLRSRAVILEEKGGKRIFHGLSSDITEHKRSEEEILQKNRDLAALNQIATIAGQSYDPSHILADALAKVREIMGMDSGAVLLLDDDGRFQMKTVQGYSRRFMKEVSKAAADSRETLIWKVARSGELLYTSDVAASDGIVKEPVVKEGLKTFVGVPLKVKDRVIGELCLNSGQIRELSSSDLQLLETIGGYLGIMIENIALVHQAAEVEALRELDHLRTLLLSTVSHELRTPLTAIKGYASLLMDYGDRLREEEKGQYLEAIDRSSNRLTALIDQLLDMSRIGSGVLKIDKTPNGMRQILQGAVNDARVRAPDYRIELKMAEPLPDVEIDTKRIHQVLDNFLDNAVKYSVPKTEIQVKAFQDGPELIVSVTDQGVGISEDDLSRVFDQMYRVDSELNVRVGGVGLGLSICKGLIEAHDGRIWAESKAGKGSTFSFALPVRIKDRPED